MILKTTIGDSNHQFKKTKVKKPSHQKYLSLIIKTITGDSINYQISTMISLIFSKSGMHHHFSHNQWMFHFKGIKTNRMQVWVILKL